MLKRSQVVSRQVLCAAATLALTALPGTKAWGTNYALTDLSNLTGTVIPVNALSLNASDQVVGNYNPSGQGSIPFIYSPSTGLNAIPGFTASSNATANAINNSGLIVGSDPGTGKGFIYSGGAVSEISPISTGTLTFSGVNNNGIAVGASTTAGGASQVVTYGVQSQAFTNVGSGFTGPSGTSVAGGINDTGQVVGLGIASASAGSSSAYNQPFLATPVNGGGFNYSNVGTAVEPLVKLYGAPYPYYTGQAVDQLGNVSGAEGGSYSNTYPAVNNNQYGYLYNASAGASLISNSAFVLPTAIADVAGSPEIVGTALTPIPGGGRTFDAFVYYKGTFTDISGIFNGELLAYPSAVNSNGDILVSGFNRSSNVSHSFLLTVLGATVKYTGATSNSWDTTSNNFTPSLYADGYAVVFDDTATGSTTINIPSTVAPAGVTFNNSSKSYVFNGAGISGGSASYFNLNAAGSVTLNNPNIYAGPTNVSAGTLIIGTTGSIASTTVNVFSGGTLRVQSGGFLTAANTLNGPPSLALTVGGTVSLDNYGSGTQTVLGVKTLSLSGTTNAWTGKLDLSNNDLVVYRGSLAQVTNQVKSGYANGTWTGNGITSSAAATDPSHLTALGVIQDTTDQTVGGSSTQLYSNFSTGSVSASDVLVGYTYYGDTNLDGQVDGTDYSRVDSAYLNNQNTSNVAMTGWYNGDFNYDGVIDGSDYTLIDNAFNSQGSNLGGGSNPNAGYFAEIAAQISSPAGTTAVPEPAALGLLSAAALGALRRRPRAARPVSYGPRAASTEC